MNRASSTPACRSLAQVFVAFYQVITIFGSTYSVRLPRYYWDWMRYFDFLSLRWDELLGVPAGCLASSFSEQLLLSALAPLVLIAAMYVVLTLRAGCAQPADAAGSSQEGRAAKSLRAVLADGLLATCPFALVVTYAFVPAVSARIFKAWSCQGFGNTPTQPIYYMREDLSIECYTSDAHKAATNVAIVLVILWPFGVLVLNAVLLLAARRPLLSRTPNRLVKSTAFLHRDYHPECFYWELIELVRRTFLTGWVLLFDETSSFVRILVGLMVSVAMLMLVVIRQPYQHYEDHYLAVSAQFMIVISFIGAMAIKVYEDVDASAEQQGVYDLSATVFGFGTSDELVNLLLSFTILMIFPFLFFTLAYNVAQEGRVLTILLRGTGKPPELTLHRGKKYHLFNSHIWSTGQDVAATIKRQLQRLFPVVKIFLDVDDLEDLSKLEQYVGESAVVLLLLSKGYFLSISTPRSAARIPD